MYLIPITTTVLHYVFISLYSNITASFRETDPNNAVLIFLQCQTESKLSLKENM